MSKPGSTNQYVNNAEFLRVIIEYKKACRIAKKEGKPKPKIPDYAGECLLLIAENLSHKPWFNGFTWKEEMIGDGIENCARYFDNFNPNKYKNPFAYFTQIIYFAFHRRIIKERKMLYGKYKYAQHQLTMGNFEYHENEDGSVQQVELYDNINDFIKTFEDFETKRKAKKKAIVKK